MDRKTPSTRVLNKTRLVHYEKELKTLLRRQLDKVEPGLVAADDGREREVASGRIDITARDVDGNFVVIELKAGPCPAGALEQVLGYSSDLEEETGTRCWSHQNFRCDSGPPPSAPVTCTLSPIRSSIWTLEDSFLHPVKAGRALWFVIGHGSHEEGDTLLQARLHVIWPEGHDNHRSMPPSGKIGGLSFCKRRRNGGKDRKTVEDVTDHAATISDLNFGASRRALSLQRLKLGPNRSNSFVRAGPL